MNTPAFNSHKISEALENRPFNDFADQEFFAERCKVHDNLCPYFLPREEREALEAIPEKEYLEMEIAYCLKELKELRRKLKELK